MMRGDERAGVSQPLDLLSTLQKVPLRCTYGAPLMAILAHDKSSIEQTCCNHWDCPRCKHVLAAQHKARMVHGANVLSETHQLYFWTLTCRGRDLDLTTADDRYYEWTNRLLSAVRARAKREHARFEYVQVTERQQRGAAHSHLIATYAPPDAKPADAHNLVSEWLVKRCVSAGLGPQCRLSEVQSPLAVAAYISGYLQKQLQADVWPKHWKRIRYSRQWPVMPEREVVARALITMQDWNAISKWWAVFDTDDILTYEYARHRITNVRPPQPKT